MPAPTYLDGKVFNDITDTKSYARCGICQCPPSWMNHYEDFKHQKEFKLRPETYIHGLPPVHTRMRLFVTLMNVACKLHVDPSKSQARGDDKIIAQERKKEIQKEFREKLNLRVEEPRASGGTSTTGKVARLALEKYHKETAEILKINPQLVKNCGLITSALSSSYHINPDPFEDLCRETGELYVQCHPNIFMSNTMHKVTAHGGQIVRQYKLAPIFYAEEGSEAKNKHYKHDKAHHARLDCREHIMKDLFCRSLHYSDPLTFADSIQRRLRKSQKNRTPMSDELKKLLIIPQEPQEEESQESNVIEEEELPDDEMEFFFSDNAEEFELIEHENV